MKKILLITALFPLIAISQNTWDGSSTSTITTTGSVGIGIAPASTMSFSINNTSKTYGIYNNNNLTVAGTQYGIYNTLSNTSASGNRYGIYSHVSGASVYKYGVYASTSSSGSYGGGSAAAATSYALYATASGAATRAAYFNGDIEMNNSNSIFASSNGNKILFLGNWTGTTPDNYSFGIALNQTNNQYDWDWGTSFYLMRSGEMKKNVKTSGKAFIITRADLSVDVFRIYGDGKVFATEVNVKLASNFPDYVFTPSYNLLPINELNSYIKKNGKLPNMPSAAIVEADGLNVGETSRLLVEKIEELTLYIIQQQELIEKQEVRLKELEEKVK